VSDLKTTKIGAGKPGLGRPKGCENKLTRDAKAAFQSAFDEIGGAEALAKWARENSTEFYKLYARLIPTDMRLGAKDNEALPGAVYLPLKAFSNPPSQYQNGESNQSTSE
jgi:hypothetical protein